MTKEEKGSGIEPFELVTRLGSDGEQFYAARLLRCGFTAYGDTPEHAVSRLKQMADFYITAYYRRWKEAR